MSENRSREHVCISVPQFIQIAQEYWSELGWVFRGQDNIEWPLRPKVGRDEFYAKATRFWVKKGQSSSDLGRFNVWREQAVAYTDRLPENDFECLAFAQHYGLATRLLDWSTNPLVALYFAVEMQGETDGAVFCHLSQLIIDRKNASIDQQFDSVALLIPRPFDRRIAAQSGVFTYHFHPERPLTATQVSAEMGKAAPDGVDLVVIRVPTKAKPILQRQLSVIGISRKYLFPDLEGLSEFLNWDTRRIANRKKRAKPDDMNWATFATPEWNNRLERTPGLSTGQRIRPSWRKHLRLPTKLTARHHRSITCPCTTGPKVHSRRRMSEIAQRAFDDEVFELSATPPSYVLALVHGEPVEVNDPYLSRVTVLMGDGVPVRSDIHHILKYDT